MNVDQIIDKKTVAIPGAMGDVTVQARVARDEAVTAAGKADMSASAAGASASQAGVNGRQAAIDALASDPTVAQAAAQRALSDQDLTRSTWAPDTGAPGMSFGVSDSSGRVGWLAMDDAGGIPDHSRRMISQAVISDVADATAASTGVSKAESPDGISFAVLDRTGRSPLAFDASGRLLPACAAAIAPSLYRPIMTATRSRTDRITCAGDSLTEGGSPGPSYPARLADMIPTATVTNLGQSARMSQDIATHVGASIATVSAGVIPESGPSDAFTITDTPHVGKHNTSLGESGLLAGVHGIMRYDGVFTREVDGDQTSVPDGTRFLPDAVAQADAEGLFILWAGQNDLAWGYPYVDTAPADCFRAVAAMLKASVDMPRMIVLGVHTVGLNYLGDIQRQNTNLKAAIREDTGVAAIYIDIHSIAVTKGLAMAGITPTDADKQAMASNIVPPSLIDNGPHFNDAAKHLVIAASVEHMLALHDWKH
ncbi:MAG: SGNH/GDSL hydrolase family protein [Bifidobacterium mongoliense]|jgi:lysophospholipase L1-like esterase|uniref:SGNH/GDSL hydrolase family protein n=1 Tax=Bifidobacterium mongoliense TaxID=518643 RepID=UPI002F356473